MTWLEEIVNAFQSRPGPMTLGEIYVYIAENTTRILPRNYDAIIRRAIEAHSSDSRVFINRGDLFHSTEGIGRGVWELRFSDPEPEAPDTVEPNLPDRANVEINRVIRDTKIAKSLKCLYKNKCQICGKTIKLNNRSYSEAHHLKPLGRPHNGPDTWENIIILCPNHHVEFDYGALGIDSVTLRIIHIDMENDYHGRLLTTDRNHRISREYLQYHIENIYNT